MAESYFEHATVTVKAADGTSGPNEGKMKTKRFVFTRPYSGPAKVTFYRAPGDEVIATKDVTIKNGRLESPVTQQMPAVRATEKSYDFRVVCEYKNSVKALLTGVIWPKEVKAAFVDQADQPLKFFNLLLKQGGAQEPISTDANGKATIELRERAPYTLEPAGKYLVVSDTQVTPGQFRNHQVKVKTTITAKFLKPDIASTDYLGDAAAAPAKKQWVNLKSAGTEHAAGYGCRAKGHTVVFSFVATDAAQAEPGAKVYFEADFGGQSKRNDPKPGVLGTTFAVSDLVDTPGATAPAKKTTGYVTLDRSARPTAYLEVELGIAGGDTFELKIGGTPAVADATLKLINWRKIYVQITRTDTLTKPSLATAVDCFKEVQIDLEESPADEVAMDVASAPAASVVDGTKMRTGAPAACLVVGDHNVDDFKVELDPHFAADGLPVAHLIYCNLQLDADNAPFTKDDILVKGDAPGQTRSTIAFPGASGRVPGAVVLARLAGSDARFFPTDLTDGSDAVKSCTWHEVGGTGTGIVTSADYKIDAVTSGNKLFVRLPTAAKALSDAGKDIIVKCEVAYALGDYNGWCTSDGRHNVIVVGRPDKDICGTIVHEIGHAIHQAAQSPYTAYPGMATETHPRFYTNARGHQGPHCANGVPAAHYDDLTKRMDTDVAEGACTCVMFGAGTSTRNAHLAFCTHCTPYVRAAPIIQISH